jgi:hybrid cluster-associated redox disulfide protein
MTYSTDMTTSTVVTRDSNLGDIAKTYPQAAAVMLEFGLHCIGCFANQFDTVEMGARIHGMTETEVDEMLQRINEAIA